MAIRTDLGQGPGASRTVARRRMTAREIPSQRAGAGRKPLVLAVVLGGSFMAVLDVGFGAVELVISAYTLTYACLLVTGGRLGALYGRRNLFIAGLVVFTAASGLCGAAPSIAVLVAARGAEGGGGALMYPQVLAIIQVTFDGQERVRALGLFGSTAGMAAVAGQLVGGALLAANVFELTWRPIFLVNVPLGVLAVVAAA